MGKGLVLKICAAGACALLFSALASAKSLTSGAIAGNVIDPI